MCVCVCVHVCVCVINNSSELFFFHEERLLKCVSFTKPK